MTVEDSNTFLNFLQKLFRLDRFVVENKCWNTGDNGLGYFRRRHHAKRYQSLEAT